MKILLLLVQLTAQGMQPTAIEMRSLDECWTQARAIMAKADLVKMQEAGVSGAGTGCIVIPAPSQDADGH